MNRIEAIKYQLAQIAEHITGPKCFSLETLRMISAELRAAADAIDAEIVLRRPPLTDGGAA